MLKKEERLMLRLFRSQRARCSPLTLTLFLCQAEPACAASNEEMRGRGAELTRAMWMGRSPLASS